MLRAPGKAAEDGRTPRRFALAWRLAAAPAFGLRQSSGAFGDGIEPQLRFSGSRRRGKAAEDCRTPRRFALAWRGADWASFWTAPFLWRFGGGHPIHCP